MAKKQQSTSTVAAWDSEMRSRFSKVFSRFEVEMNHEGFTTTGHLFGQLGKAEDFILRFLIECNVTPPDNLKNVEQVKEALAAAFENGKPFENWQCMVAQKYPTAFQSLMAMLGCYNVTLDELLAPAKHIMATLIVWMRNCNVVIAEEKVNPMYLQTQMERALSNSEALANELAY